MSLVGQVLAPVVTIGSPIYSSIASNSTGVDPGHFGSSHPADCPLADGRGSAYPVSTF